jgi:hypothetical protein
VGKGVKGHVGNATATPGGAALRGVRLALVAAAVTGAAAGVVLAAGVLRGRDADRLTNVATPFASEYPTSFGIVAVAHAEKLSGATAKDLVAGAHGGQGLVGPEQSQVSVSVTFTNMLDAPVAYSPDQFRLRVDGADAVPVTESGMQPGTLQPNAAIEARLGFVVPRRASGFALEFEDAGKQSPVVIDLGRLDQPAAAYEHPDH